MVNKQTKIHKQHYKNKCKQDTQTTIMNVNNNVYNYKDFEKAESRTFAFNNFHQTLPYKRQGKSVGWVCEVQSVLGEDTICLKSVIVVWRS